MTSFATPLGSGLRREAVTEANGNVCMGAFTTTTCEVLHGDQKRQASLPCGCDASIAFLGSRLATVHLSRPVGETGPRSDCGFSLRRNLLK
jgi:hypothetical protein